MSVKSVRHIFSRLLILYAAMYTIDVSVDTDHLKQHSTHVARETDDDIDSFSEYLLELITGNDNLVAEGDHDDQNPHPEMNKLADYVKLVITTTQYDLTPVCLPVESKTSPISDILFQQDDYSQLVAPPPKQLS